VHFVQIKCPLLTLARVGVAENEGEAVATRDTLKSMGLSRGASALGAAVALGEADPGSIADADICTRYAIFSRRASTSGGVELLDHEIVVLGMGNGWSGPFAIDHAVMENAIDTSSVLKARDRLPASARLTAVLAKAEPDPWERSVVCATPCSTIPTYQAHAMPAPSSAACSPASSA
jgi:cyanuric acid amidohydrolase